MAHKRTLPYEDGPAQLPVDTLSVEVSEGPDAGTRLVAETETLTLGSAEGNDLVLGDPTISRYHAELERTEEGIRVRDNGSTNGVWIGAVRVQAATVPPGTTLKLGGTTLRVGEGERKHVKLHGDDRLGDLRGRSAVMRRLMSQIERAARTEASVLRMLEGSPQTYLHDPIVNYLEVRVRGRRGRVRGRGRAQTYLHDPIVNYLEERVAKLHPYPCP